MDTEMITLEIDGQSVSVPAGTTIFEAAKTAGIDIPNLCYLKELGPYGACGVCVVEVENCPKMLRACSAKVAPGMVVHTKSEKALATRKLALELLMGDHDGDCQGPCKLNCPAHTDCQKYVKEIAEGRFADAVATVKETFPLPAAIGRVCPHPCEKACRRNLVEQPISIAQLKYFAADQVRKDGNEHPIKVAAPTGKKVGIIGGGPAGLTAAFKLAQWGHDVTVYDQMPEMGGMLRYGIPEYRLPKAILKAETDAIEALGVNFINNFKIGRDADFAKFRSWFELPARGRHRREAGHRRARGDRRRRQHRDGRLPHRGARGREGSVRRVPPHPQGDAGGGRRDHGGRGGGRQVQVPLRAG